jgi:hypothetical protein
MDDRVSRRAFLKQGGLLGAALAAMGRRKSAAAAPAALMPTIRLGHLEVSRLMLGGYPFIGLGSPRWLTCRDMQAYYTHERIVETLGQASGCGITGILSPGHERVLEALKAHRAAGKAMHWIAECADKGDQDKPLRRAASQGAAACYIHAGRVDGHVRSRDFGTLRRWLDGARKAGVPLGLGVHSPTVLAALDKVDVGQAFYVLCVYRWQDFAPEAPEKAFDPRDRQRAFEAVREVRRPVIVCKIMAAGYHDPEEAFAYAFKRLAAKDGACVGVFTKDDPDQVGANAGLARRLSAG